MYNILVIGSGGREHCLAWKLSQSTKCGKLYIAPGNAGSSLEGENLSIDTSDFSLIEEFVDKAEIDYIIVGPEAPLVAGIYDHFKSHRVKVLGPSAEASKLEGSKAFANDFMDEFKIPTAGYLTVGPDSIDQGYDFIDAQDETIVLKADGLAAGKGVLILQDKGEAKKELKEMLSGKFGEASKTVVLEEFLDGIEFSVFILTDGKDYVLLPEAKDYKRIGEGDTGLNTGGMGAVSPVNFADANMMAKVRSRIIEPTMKGLSERGLEYKGFIFFGLINVGGDPYVIEYNCRLGDPETQVILPRLDTDLMELVESVFSGDLATKTSKSSPQTAATVVLVSGGYPGSYPKGKEISFPKDEAGSIIFHAGTQIDGSGKVVTSGGRVLAISSFGNNHIEAVNKSLDLASKVHFDGMYYRKDIGFDL